MASNTWFFEATLFVRSRRAGIQRQRSPEPLRHPVRGPNAQRVQPGKQNPQAQVADKAEGLKPPALKTTLGQAQTIWLALFFGIAANADGGKHLVLAAFGARACEKIGVY